MPIRMLPPFGCGESVTGVNIGTAGTGVFKQKNGYNLEFKKLNSLSEGLIITDDTENDKIDFELNTGSISSMNIWYDMSGSRTGSDSFTFSGTAADAKKIIEALFCCMDSEETTMRMGYVKDAVESEGIITVTVVSDSDLEEGDKDFLVAPMRKIPDCTFIISIPGTLVPDPDIPQGEWLSDMKFASILLPVDSSLLTAASGENSSCAWNVYSDSIPMFNSDQEMGSNSTFNERRPDINTINPGETITIRITDAGGTVLPADFQAKLYIVTQSLFEAY